MNPPPLIPPPTLPAPAKTTPQTGCICPHCGTTGWPKTITPGSLAVEIVLWLLLIVPGIIYSTWRLSSRHQGCPTCGHEMIPIATPRGRALTLQYHGTHPAT